MTMPRSPGPSSNRIRSPIRIYCLFTQLIGSLPNLPVGYARRNDSTPVEQTFGLSQRPRLQDASNDLYRQALERFLRPRLILSLEQQIQKNIDDPSFVYEALKVYLMLGGKAPQVDNDLILDWFARDWEERTFPGAPNAQGRALLARSISRPCSTWTTGKRERFRSMARWSSRRRRRLRGCAWPSGPTRF